VKYGKTKKGKQRYKCKSCGKTFLTAYSYASYRPSTNGQIKTLVKEGVGIRSISRILGISKNTVLSRIQSIATRISRPKIYQGKEYQLDELCTFIGYKRNFTWIAYAIRKDSKEVIDFKVGKRTNKTLRSVTTTLILSNPKKIHTDKLKNYRYLIPPELHHSKKYGTNHIERKNLSLRTHLKRLNRRTICFSRSHAMLVACLKIYFWG
jgi:IS1 family transposase